MVDGHELSIVSNFVGMAFLMNRTLPTGWGRHLIHRHPMGAIAVAFGATGIALPLILPPIRRALGLPTDQYDSEHPNVKRNKWVEDAIKAQEA
mmetsp:Transcript_10517/g.21643  ORF Transcript_10517/g.21643 Transcript_10517/m.21643 type:complete len:93 (+) Transcript_10517:252-530(+)